MTESVAMRRQLAKNHSLSFMIGPPTPKLKSGILATRDPVCSPRARSSSVTLFACQSPSVPPTNAWPREDVAAVLRDHVDADAAG